MKPEDRYRKFARWSEKAAWKNSPIGCFRRRPTDYTQANHAQINLTPVR